jgi:hypothetical protein
MAQPDVGLQGTSMSTYEDMRALYADILLDTVSSTLIIQPPYSAVTMSNTSFIERRETARGTCPVAIGLGICCFIQGLVFAEGI